MTLDCKKKFKCSKIADLKKKNFNFAQKSDGFWPGKNIFFHPIIIPEGHCMEKQVHNKLKKDPSRSDDLLSSYSCSKFEKCSFEKNAFKDKRTDFIVINF